jgi:hypothetical protein
MSVLSVKNKLKGWIIIHAKLRGLSTKIFGIYWIYNLFSNGKRLCTWRTSGGPQSRSVHRAPWPRSGGALDGVERATATGYRGSPRYDGKEEGSKGVLTTGSKWPGCDGMRPAMRV